MADMETSEAHKRWAMLALLFAARIGLDFQFQTLGSVADPLAAELGLNFAEIGTLIGLFMLSGIFLSTPAGIAGWLYDKSGDAFAAILFAIGLLMLTIAANVVFRVMQASGPSVQHLPS